MADIIPKEALEYFRRKKLKPTDHWTDLWHGEHARFFTVARSTYGDILNDVYREVERSLNDGLTLKQFRENLEPTLIKKGWWGRTPDGVQLGSPRRLKVIYDTNLRSSYAAGRWERIQNSKQSFPYLEYNVVNDGRERPEHSAWDGIILPVDHPFWNTHYPPNGWGCRCSVRQLSKYDMKQQGLKVSRAPKIEHKNYVNKKTGEVLKVPNGISPGFDYNAGVANLRVKSRQNIAEKLAGFNKNIAKETLKSIVKSDDFRDFYDNPKGYYSVAVIDDEVKASLGAKTNISYLSDETLIKNKTNHPDITMLEYMKINELMDKAELVVKDGANTVVYVTKQSKDYWIALKVTRNKEEVFVTSFRKARKGQIERIAKGEIIKGTR